MRKVTKIFFKLVSAILLLLIFLPVFVALLLSLPSVQNRVVDKVSQFASSYIGATVSIDHITVGVFNRVKVRGFYVEDLDRDTLIYAGSVTAYLGGLSNLGEGLVINYGKVENGKFLLRETDRGPMNVKEVVDKISKKKGQGKFKMLIRSLEGENIEFYLDRKAKLPEDKCRQRVDYADMRIRNISTRISDFYVEKGAVGGDIRRLSFVERSGFVLDDLSAAMRVDKGKITFTALTLDAERTHLELPNFSLTGADWTVYKDFIRNVRIDGEVVNSSGWSHTVGFFAPAIREWDTQVRNASFSMHGTVADFVGRIDNVKLEDGGSLRASAHVKGLLDIPNTQFDVTVERASATTPELVRLVGNIARLNIPLSVMPYLDRTERLNISGHFKGILSRFEADADVVLGVGGGFSAKCSMQRGVDDMHIVADLATRDVEVGCILSQPLMGPLTGSFDAEVVLAEEGAELSGNGAIERFTINDYTYRNIDFAADYLGAERNATLDFNANDESLQAALYAAIHLPKGRRNRGEAADVEANANEIYTGDGADEPACEAVLELERADLHAMGINRRDSVSVLKASLSVAAQGATLDTLDGELSIADASYEYNDTTLYSELATLQVSSNEDIRTVQLASDFADVVFESRSDYKDVIYYVRTLLARYLPEFYDEQVLAQIESKGEVLRNNVAMLSATAKRIDPLLACLTSGVEVAEGTTLQLFMNPSENRFLMRGVSDFISRNNIMATELKLNAGNAKDSLSMSLGTKDLYLGSMRLNNMQFQGGVKDNVLDVRGIFADTVGGLRGDMDATARVSRRGGMRHVNMQIRPSTIVYKNRHWDISSGEIAIDSTRIAVDNFLVEDDERSQQLLVDGVASRSKQDSISVKLDNFSISPLGQFVQNLGYRLTGNIDGFINVRSALRDSEIHADVSLENVETNGRTVPDLHLLSTWDFGRSRARLSLCRASDNKEIVRGYYSPSDNRYYARMQTKALPLGYIEPLLESVITDTQGTAEADLVLMGQGRIADLSGEIQVKGLQTMLKYTCCTYSAPKATIKVAKNVLSAIDVPIFDAKGHEGALNINVSLNHLSNIEYDIGARFRNMQVLNTGKRDNDMFYGNVFGSGTVSVRGDKAGVTMDIVASSDDNSRFFMPLSDKSNISSADFVTFVNPNSVDTTSYLVRKKLMFERRQRQRTAAGGGMDITMALDVRPNAEVQLVIDPTVGDIIKGRGDGLLNLRINPAADIFEMYGDYTIEEGSYLFTLQNIVNKKFVIERGSTIQWTGEPLDALLNIDAIYKLKASLQPLLEGYISQDSHSIPTRAVPVECVIHLADRLTRPTVTFDVLVPSVDPNIQSIITNVLSTPERRSQQFLYLLVANSFISDNTATASTYGASTAAATGFELLSNQLSNWLATENSNIVLRYRPRTEQMMSDEVDFGFSQALLNNRILIEVEGNYLVDKSQVVNAASSFTGEAYVTWLIDKAGTLRLKGFTHTIDRFDENQGLQETGIGIYYKEDFDNAADLRRRVKNRFSRKRKTSPRAEKDGEKSAGEDSVAEKSKSENENLNK